jgi:hypothetical protein
VLSVGHDVIRAPGDVATEGPSCRLNAPTASSTWLIIAASGTFAPMTSAAIGTPPPSVRMWRFAPLSRGFRIGSKPASVRSPQDAGRESETTS